MKDKLQATLESEIAILERVHSEDGHLYMVALNLSGHREELEAAAAALIERVGPIPALKISRNIGGLTMRTRDIPTEPGMYLSRVTVDDEVGDWYQYELTRDTDVGGQLYAVDDGIAVKDWGEEREWIGPFTADDVERGTEDFYEE